MQLIRFSRLADVPLHYDRFEEASGFGYGTRGKPLTFRAVEGFVDAMEALFQDLFQRVPGRFGAAEVIATAGAYVDKPGYHGLGRAFDLDALFFTKRDFVTLNFPSDPYFYLAVESVIRMHFGTVLNYDYDPAHRDHFHFDDGSAIGWKKYAKSHVVFVQNVLNHCYGMKVDVDGVFGPSSAQALGAVLSELGIGAISNKANWLAFLDRSASEAFSRA
ncbi:MAG: extensin family protein [Acetobacteraceae bacterium]